jgi:hypothetical protein
MLMVKLKADTVTSIRNYLGINHLVPDKEHYCQQSQFLIPTAKYNIPF